VIARTSELETVNSELEKRILEHEELNLKFQQINNEKTKYLMHATHQLKAPFAAIQSYTDLILDGYTGNIPEQTHDIILKIKDRCVLLSNSIKEMLELANLKSMVMENIQMEPESLNKMIISSINHLKEFAASRDIGIQYEPLPDTLSVRCNRNQILILLSNLIENAISYSPPHTSISINADQFTPTQIRISVSDKGIGIAKQFQRKIFEEYFRTNEAVAFNDKSTGLGLAIVQEIANIHHIFMEVESTPLKGSTFFFVMNLV
jgi:signal transduction histidine kinase